MPTSSLNETVHRSGKAWRCVALVVGLAVAVLCVVRPWPIHVDVVTLQSWAETRGTIGMVGFGAAYVVLALLFVPGAALTMMAGAVFGIGRGLLVVAIATSVADAAAFLLGRYVARDAVLRLMDRYPRFTIVDRTISRGGWRIVALIRLNPTIPYSASNYLFGVTGVTFLPFLVSSGIFTLPGAFAYLYLGYVGAETLGGSSRSPVEWALLVLGLVITVVALVYVTVLARRGLAELE
jgi:uncharacterized membrane protein YdjX (TVP38/TMEM64 family)